MAQTADDYVLRLLADNKDAINKVKEVAEQTEKMGKRSTNVFESLKKNWLALTALVTGYILVGKKLIDSYIQQEKADIRLTSALEAQGKATDANIKSMKNLAKELQKTAGIGDETAQEMIGLALNMGVLPEEMDKTIKSAIGLSKAMGIDANQALKLVQASANGNTDRMRRMIPALQNVNSESERMAIINKAIASGWNQTTKEVNSAGGQLNQLKLTFGDLLEVLGEILAKAILPMVTWLAKVIDQFINLNPNIRNTIVSAGLLVTALIGVAGGIKAIGLASAFLNLNPVMLAISGAVVAITGLIALIKKAKDDSRLLRGDVKEEDREKINKRIVDENKKIENAIKSRTRAEKAWYAGKSGELQRQKVISGWNDAIAESNKKIAIQMENLKKLDKELAPTESGTGITVKPKGDDEEPVKKTFQEEILEAEKTVLKKLEIEKAYLEERGKLYQASLVQKDIDAQTDIVQFTENEILKTDITKQELETRLAMEKDLADKKAALNSSVYNATKDILSQATALMGSENEKQFKIGKAAAVANAGIGLAEAIMKTFATFGFPLGLPFAGALAGLGAVQIGNIMKTQFNPPKAAKGALVDSKQVLMAGEAGPELILPAKITRFIQDSVGMGRSGGGGTTQVFNLNAKVIDKMALQQFSKEIFKETEAWQSRNEAY
jgi:hypothetical protein